MNYQELHRRVGRFKIGRELMEEWPISVQLLMSRCIPVRAEALWAEDCIEYTALSEDFREVPEGALAPNYAVEMTIIRNDDDEAIGADVKFVT